MTPSGNQLFFSLTVILGSAALAPMLSGCSSHPVENSGVLSGASGIVAHAEAGELTAVQRALAAGEEVSARNSHGETALMVAAINGHTQVVRLLIRAGAPVDDKSRRGNTALILAAEWGQLETVTVLLKIGASVRARGLVNEGFPRYMGEERSISCPFRW